jgi:hypothetical protein
MDRVDSIRRKFLALGGVMDERVVDERKDPEKFERDELSPAA